MAGEPLAKTENKEQREKKEGLKITLPQKKMLIKLGILLLAGIFLMFLASSWQKDLLPEENMVQGETSSATSASSKLSSSEEAALEEKIAAALGQMAGVGQVTVTLTYARSGQGEYAINGDTVSRTEEQKDTDGSLRVTSETTESRELALAGNGGSPILLGEGSPEIQGVLVVAEGAENIKTKVALTEAVQGLLGISPHRIIVTAAKGR